MGAGAPFGGNTVNLDLTQPRTNFDRGPIRHLQPDFIHFRVSHGYADSPMRFVFFVPLSPNYRMRTVAKITLSRGSFLLILIWVSSCGARQSRECEKRIAQEIHVGVPVETADGVLKRCGFKTTLDVAKNTLYADKRVGWLIVDRTQVLVTLDSDKKVAGVTVITGLIGP
jgi:hypothetical protein